MIQIYVAGHKASLKIPGDTFIPIHVGKRGANNSFCLCGDDVGDHISHKNDTFCELTALYWIWKNTSEQDYVGLFHYRRHLNLSKFEFSENEWGVVEYHTIDEDYYINNGLTDKGVVETLADYDLILPKKWDVGNAGSTSMRDHYKNGSEHFIDDYDNAVKILEKKYPDYAPYIARVNESRSGYFTNMFIMKREYFDKYCDWLFDILFELEKHTDISIYSVQERRIYGYISEWLFNIFVEKLIADNAQLRVKTVQRTFIVNTDERPDPVPSFRENIVPIVMAVNDEFLPYAGVTIISILENSSKKKNYDVFIFDGGISEQNKLMLKNMLKHYSHVSINYLNPSNLFSGLHLPVHMHFSKDIYYRLYIPEVFKAFEKIIYIDGDTIVKGDLSKLLEVDMGGAHIAAVKDCVMAGFRKFQTPSLPFTGALEAEAYLTQYLGMKDVSAYFQSGLIVFNIEKSGSHVSKIKKILEAGKRYWFPDQDILNLVYEGKVHFLDARWNVFHGNGDLKTFFDRLPAGIRDDFFKSRQDPFVIHYAGEKKPWLVPGIDFAEEFWAVARNTPWYEKMIFNLADKKSNSHPVNQSQKFNRVVLRPFENALRKIRKRIKSI